MHQPFIYKKATVEWGKFAVAMIKRKIMGLRKSERLGKKKTSLPSPSKEIILEEVDLDLTESDEELSHYLDSSSSRTPSTDDSTLVSESTVTVPEISQQEVFRLITKINEIPLQRNVASAKKQAEEETEEQKNIIKIEKAEAIGRIDKLWQPLRQSKHIKLSGEVRSSMQLIIRAVKKQYRDVLSPQERIILGGLSKELNRIGNRGAAFKHRNKLPARKEALMQSIQALKNQKALLEKDLLQSIEILGQRKKTLEEEITDLIDAKSRISNMENTLLQSIEISELRKKALEEEITNLTHAKSRFNDDSVHKPLLFAFTPSRPLSPTEFLVQDAESEFETMEEFETSFPSPYLPTQTNFDGEPEDYEESGERDWTPTFSRR